MKDLTDTVINFDHVVEMVAKGGFPSSIQPELPNLDKLYKSITLAGDLKKYNLMQLKALKDYAKEQLPDKSDDEISEFMQRALMDPKYHKALRLFIAHNNPELFNYIK
tara:strand:- start:1592 stop:1915 length:324 start_codon:yes stop_codon:yes gene_type:complete